jgi:hypothetical protein
MYPEEMISLMKITMVINVMCSFLFWKREKYGMSKFAASLSLVSVVVILGLKTFA